MDTCCIDKKDVLETQTSIHGMYDFYANAVVCYAYLADVSGVGAPEERNAQVKRSRWFTRGWTLQEWLAPRSLVYLDQEWRVIGTREHFDDIPRLSSTFKRFTQPRILSVRFWNLATKLSWASQRQTTMLEDQAYSICGLLQIKLPVRYGQNDTKSVFRHLQEALINEYHDLSLLAWFDSPG
jgi:hypothetical protein